MQICLTVHPRTPFASSCRHVPESALARCLRWSVQVCRDLVWLDTALYAGSPFVLVPGWNPGSWVPAACNRLKSCPSLDGITPVLFLCVLRLIALENRPVM